MELSLNCLLLGDNYTGKTCFSQALHKRKNIETRPLQTIGVNYACGKILLNGFTYKLNLWELSGSKRFIPIAKTYLKIANVVLLFFSYNNIESITNLRIWIDILKERVDNNYKIFIIGSWLDVKDSCDKESKDYIANIIDYYNYDLYEVISINFNDVKRVLEQICLNYRVNKENSNTKRNLCCLDSLSCIY